jgi:hypothetical protein
LSRTISWRVATAEIVPFKNFSSSVNSVSVLIAVWSVCKDQRRERDQEGGEGRQTNRLASSISFLNSNVSVSNCFKVFSASNFVALPPIQKINGMRRKGKRREEEGIS